jgi:hypothetical protein
VAPTNPTVRVCEDSRHSWLFPNTGTSTSSYEGHSLALTQLEPIRTMSEQERCSYLAACFKVCISQHVSLLLV